MAKVMIIEDFLNSANLAKKILTKHGHETSHYYMITNKMILQF
jgi:hypothetical protein